MTDETNEIPEYESSVRRMVADGTGTAYTAVKSLAEAQTLEGYAVVMQGDYGGQIYLSCPVSAIRCDEATLRQLLTDIDDLQWEDSDGAGLYFELARAGVQLAGGMQGGVVTSGVWMHDDLRALGLTQAIENVIAGAAEQLVIPTLDQLEAAAESGKPEAQFFLAERLQESGKAAESNEWYQRAADNGVLQAQQKLVNRYKQPPSERFHWLSIIAQRTEYCNQVHSAQFDLASAYHAGEGIEKNLESAAAWYARAVESRYYAAAAMKLGQMYLAGQGVAVDARKGLMLLLLADHRVPPYYWYAPVSDEDRKKLQQQIVETKVQMAPDDLRAAQQLLENVLSAL